MNADRHDDATPTEILISPIAMRALHEGHRDDLRGVGGIVVSLSMANPIHEARRGQVHGRMTEIGLAQEIIP